MLTSLEREMDQELTKSGKGGSDWFYWKGFIRTKKTRTKKVAAGSEKTKCEIGETISISI